jgi:GWxTD domain-containing protein
MHTSAHHSFHRRPRSFFPLFRFLVFAACVNSLALAVSIKQLPEQYRNWLQKDVAYIISNDEKKVFLELTTNPDRDRFIERFWEVRNPTPGSPENAFRAEHYRRIEYTNQYFGHYSHSEGWRTDMGRIYITLGEPQQRQKLLGLQKITPMEIWFYQNTNPALPPYFYVIFYQRDSGDEFRLYSPYSDGPEKLITAVAGPSRSQALNIIAQDAGKDVARETLSLLTDEPVDFQNGTASLASDVMLSTIRDLANNPMTKSEIAHRRELLEDVTHRVVLGEEFLDVVTVALRDPAGNSNLHYLLRLKKPEDFTVSAASTSGYYYSVLVATKVLGADGKPIFSDEKKLSKTISPGELDEVKGKIFGYEGVLPLPPGKYKVDFQLSNLLSNVGFHREIDVAIPGPASGIQVSDLVPFMNATTVGQGVTAPFTGAGVKFTPRVGAELRLTQGEPLRFFYQVWAPALASGGSSGKKISVDYVYGRLGAQDTKTITDEIPLNQLDPGGSVINGKQILTTELEPGNYRLVMTLHDPVSEAKIFGALNFSVNTTGTAALAWDVAADEKADGAREWERALCYLAQNDKAGATRWFDAAYRRDPANERYRDKLIEVHFEQQNYGKAVDLYWRNGLSDSTDEQTILRLAESFSRLGNLAKAVSVMEAGITLNPNSASLLLGLADYYRKSGNPDKAAAVEQKGKRLQAASPIS